MKKIEIKIPDNLTPVQETAAIAKKLIQKLLSGSGANKDQIKIGDGVDIQHLQTQITITRTSTEKPIEMVNCNVCGHSYQNNTAEYYWHNYGGNPKKIAVCSTGCKNDAIAFLGDRAATSKTKLKPIRFF